MTGGEARVARGTGGGGFAMARVLLAGAGARFAAVTGGETVGSEGAFGAVDLTFGTFPTGGATAWGEKG